VVPEARGDGLEVGLGTGLNLGVYQDLESRTAIEPNPSMLRRAQARARRFGVEARLEEAAGEALPFNDECCDTVVATFVLCTIEGEKRSGEPSRPTPASKGRFWGSSPQVLA
jgi:ubiquinone/menaquinone biosynthesis C-methylase UbiE